MILLTLLHVCNMDPSIFLPVFLTIDFLLLHYNIIPYLLFQIPPSFCIFYHDIPSVFSVIFLFLLLPGIESLESFPLSPIFFLSVKISFLSYPLVILVSHSCISSSSQVYHMCFHPFHLFS